MDKFLSSKYSLLSTGLIFLRNLTYESFIAGNNLEAARAAKVAAENKGFQSAVVSTRVEGDVRTISRIYASLARHVVDTIRDASNNSNKDKLRLFVEQDMANELRVRKEFIEELLAMDFGKAICLVLAGRCRLKAALVYLINRKPVINLSTY